MTAAAGIAASIPEHELEAVACGLCGAERHRLEFKEGPFSVVTCEACGLTYVTPRLRDGALLEHVYGDQYWSSDCARQHGYTDYKADEPLYLKTYRMRLAVVRRHFARPGRVLDVGCAAGFFLRVMRDEGWEVTGLEPSDAIRSVAREHLGDAVLPELLHEAPLAPGSFDLITFWDVIEHIPDPAAALRCARALLAPGGRILIETQNVASRAAALLGRRWQHYKHYEHIYHFNPRTLGALLERAGLEAVENSPRLGGKYVSLSFIAERAGRVHPLFSTLLAPLRLLGSRLAVYVNIYDEMIVVARPVR